MAAITRSTFNPLLSYVNVRLQQGVPIVDADWNELDDVRKFELRAFLKWYVGDGVPYGNDGFRVAGGLTNDFHLLTGVPVAPSGTSEEREALDHVGRIIVDGLDVLLPRALKYTEQALHERQPGAAQEAARLGVPVIAELAPVADGPHAVYLDVWERLVSPDEGGTKLVHPGLGVESCARMRREWAVRVRPGATVPPPGEALPGHSYLLLALLHRRAGVDAINETDVEDRRPRGLHLPTGQLLADTLGVEPDAYRRGAGRPPISLREAVNALLAGELPSTPDTAVSPAPDVDDVRRGFVLDSTGGLVATWESPRVGGTTQVVASRLRLDDVSGGFSPVQAVTSGGPHLRSTALALPGEDLLLAYQTGQDGAQGTDVVMKRGRLADLAGAAETPVSATAGVADTAVQAVVAGAFVVFLFHQQPASGTGGFFFRRYQHTTGTFPDTAPRSTTVSSDKRESHMAVAAGDQVWAVCSSTNQLHLMRYTPASEGRGVTALGASDVSTPFVLDGGGPVNAPEALVFWKDPTGLRTVTFAAGGFQTVANLPGTDAQESNPAAVREPDGTVWLVSNRSVGGLSEILLRRRSADTKEWGQPRRLIAASSTEIRPHPLYVPGQGIWLFWMSNRLGNFDLFAKRFVVSI
ncbi:DUF6519 domain-containing protein [Streptomyces sp. NPDC059010]|uniref:DUF6519 domain-containing protein n=1 Tax=Streptomyces sp. NPDC059010 TaxID=3346695 RepID=UPI0036C68A1F